MTKLNLIIFSLLLTISTALAQKTVTGVVYEDANKNRKKDARETGIKGVAVSNGKDVVLTDEKGKYSLPVDNDDIIFVIKPTGYRLPLDEQYLPQFFYVHKPAGSPQLKYAGVKPTGPLPKSVDFALHQYDEPSSFKALVFGDPQPYNLDEVGFYERGIVNELIGKSHDALLGISLGDLVGDDLSLFAPYIKATAKLKTPWHNVYGNHDMNYDVKHDTLANETFVAHFGPANYSFNYGKVHFISMDDVMYPDPRDGKGYWGGLRKDQFEFLKNDLKHVPKDYLIVFMAHIPLFDEYPHGDTFSSEDRKQLFELLSPFANTLSLSAHTHTQRHHFFKREEGWKGEGDHHHYNVGTTSGDWYSGELDANGIPVSTMRDGTPKGYAVLSFEENKYTFDYKVANESPDFKIGITAPKIIPHKKRYRGDIYANFFQGSEKDSLFYRVDNGEWRSMEFVFEQDPSMASVRHVWDNAETLPTGTRPSNPSYSYHLWKARLTSNLPVGTRTIEVKAKDQFGRTYFGKTTVEVVETSNP